MTSGRHGMPIISAIARYSTVTQAFLRLDLVCRSQTPKHEARGSGCKPIEFCTRCRNIAVQSDYRTANYDGNNCQ